MDKFDRIETSISEITERNFSVRGNHSSANTLGRMFLKLSGNEKPIESSFCLKSSAAGSLSLATHSKLKLRRLSAVRVKSDLLDSFENIGLKEAYDPVPSR